MRRNIKLAILVSAAYLGLGCATEPSVVAPAEYRLVSVGDDPLPATLHGTVVVEADVLTLLPGGEAVRERVVRDLTANNPPEQIPTRDQGTWQLDGDLLVAAFPTERMHLRVEGAGLGLRLEDVEWLVPGHVDVLYQYLYRRSPTANRESQLGAYDSGRR